jgi:hypothetical protein
LYAVVRSDCACTATASASCCVPSVITPGGKPVTDVPGLTPRSPETVDGPVLVTVEPAITANELAVPRPTEGCAAEADEEVNAPTTSRAAASVIAIDEAARNRSRKDRR